MTVTNAQSGTNVSEIAAGNFEKGARKLLDKLASTGPTMHGDSYRGDGRALLLGLAEALGA